MNDPRKTLPKATLLSRSAPAAAPKEGKATATAHPRSSALQASATGKSTSFPTDAAKNGPQLTEPTDNPPKGWDETMTLANADQSNWQHDIDDYVSMQGGLTSLTEPLSDSDPSEPETGAVFSAFSQRDKRVGSKQAIAGRGRSRSPRRRPRSRSRPTADRRHRTPSRTRPDTSTSNFGRNSRAIPRRPSVASDNRDKRPQTPTDGRGRRSSPYRERSQTRDRRGSESSQSHNKSPGDTDDAKPTVILVSGSNVKNLTYRDIRHHFSAMGYMKYIDVSRPDPLIYFRRSNECDNAYKYRNGTYICNSRIHLTQLTEAEAGPCPKSSPHADKWSHYSPKTKHRQSRSPSPRPSSRNPKTPRPDPSPPRARSRPPSPPPLRPEIRRAQTDVPAHTSELSQEDRDLAHSIKHSIPRALAQPVFCQAVVSHRIPKSFSFPIVEYIRKRDVPIGAHDVAELVDMRQAVDYFFDEGVTAVLLITYDLYKQQRVALHVNTDRLLSRPKNRVNEDEHSKIQATTAKRLIIRDYQELARPRIQSLREVPQSGSPSLPSPSPSTEIPSPVLTRPMPPENSPTVSHSVERPMPNAHPLHSLASWNRPQDVSGQSEPRRNPAVSTEPPLPMNLPHPSATVGQLAYQPSLSMYSTPHHQTHLPAPTPFLHSAVGAPVTQPGAIAPPALGLHGNVFQQAILAFGAQIAAGLLQNQGPLGGLAGLGAMTSHGTLSQPTVAEQPGLHSNLATKATQATPSTAPSSAPATPAYSNPELQSLVDQMLRHPSLASRITPGAPPQSRPN